MLGSVDFEYLIEQDRHKGWLQSSVPPMKLLLRGRMLSGRKGHLFDI